MHARMRVRTHAPPGGVLHKRTVSNKLDERKNWIQIKGNAYLSSVSSAVTLVCKASLSSICSSMSLWAFLLSPSILSSSVSPSSTCLFRALTLRASCNTGWGWSVVLLFMYSHVSRVNSNIDTHSGGEWVYLVSLFSVCLFLLIQRHVEIF